VLLALHRPRRGLSRLDSLIAAGWGSIRQELIPKEVMENCATAPEPRVRKPLQYTGMDDKAA
jgi:hypothetical protein